MALHKSQIGIRRVGRYLPGSDFLLAADAIKTRPINFSKVQSYSRSFKVITVVHFGYDDKWKLDTVSSSLKSHRDSE